MKKKMKEKRSPRKMKIGPKKGRRNRSIKEEAIKVYQDSFKKNECTCITSENDELKNVL